MPYENPYIPKCREHPRIILSKEDYILHKGKWEKYFGNNDPLVLEIGTGMGNYFSYMLTKYTNKNFIGMELRYKRLYTTARKADEACEANSSKSPLAPSAVKRRLGFQSHEDNKRYLILQSYGQSVGDVFAQEELSEIYIYFPDPFCYKQKQLKHRLLSRDFLKNSFYCTKVGGVLHFKTDHKEYFEDTLQIVKELGLWVVQLVSYDYKNSDIYDREAITEFEGLFRGEQEDFYYLILEKK
ncbi:tRNA (guanosine(46)-N7)-methyltransferase TrmB [Candidatus Gracilibacteria bacterium]|nr:tRNA (guanosine(46)-N7)-methyltransferase TrmB [Candidatus Gracilibacteria bacterium]